MFDDKPIGPVGQTPQNLPLGEPEDVFADTTEFVPVAPQQGSSTSALDAGILKPRDAFGAAPSAPLPSLTPIHIGANPEATPVSPQGNPQMDENMLPPMNTLREPTMSRGIMVAIIVILGVLLVGGAGWWVLQYLNVPETVPVEEVIPEEVVVPPEPTLPVIEETVKPEEALSDDQTEKIPEVDGVSEFDASSMAQSADQSILFGESPDTDVDGLDDKKESTLGTDPMKNDTDGDGLSDGDEVLIWGTDPLKSDTDGDTYSDGSEVKAGYNPKGSGKLFEVKSTSTSTAQ
jgi:hypothetical protein